jgi:glycosyltransferase involved in cell wall biosynthesis
VPWFEHQPSTKLYEYLHSGLLCIATDNAANRDVLTDANGVLVDDTAEGFARGLAGIVDLLPAWCPQAVAEGVRGITWEWVVADVLAPLLESIRR